MPSIYRKLRRLPIPPGAEPEKRRGVAGVRWTDGRGREQWAATERGKIVQRDERWTIQYTDAGGKVREAGSRTTDEKTAREIAASIEIRTARERRGLHDPISESLAGHAREPISDHLHGRRGLIGYADKLADKGDDKAYVRRALRMLERVFSAAKVTTLADLETGAISRAIRGFKRRDGSPISNATFNQYGRACLAFSSWAYSKKRLPEDVLRDFDFANAEEGRTLFRRELTGAELRKIFRQAELDDGRTFARVLRGGKRAGKVKRFKAPGRVWGYRIALGTGFRAGEIGTLSRDCFQLKSKPAKIVVIAGKSKRRRRDEQPISDALATQLAPWLATTPRKGPVFRGFQRWGEAIQADARAAGVAVKTPAGSIDFHALRHTYASRIAAVTDAKTGQSLTRHSSADLYLNTYAKERDASRTRAVEAIGTV